MCAVSFLNTAPLVYGLTHGPLQGRFDLSFEVPSVCADRLAAGHADIGLVPSAELDRLNLAFFPQTGIACRGPVRSILLVSKVDPARIRTLAADVSSRTSVMLARILLSEKYGATPEITSTPPVLESMLGSADAALIIGDPALRLDPSTAGPWVLDLGAEWLKLTGLPMVFAVWAGHDSNLTPAAGEVLLESARYGLSRIDEIAATSPASHGISSDLARVYLTKHIVFQLDSADLQGLQLYRRKVAALRAADEEPAVMLKT